MRGEGEIGKGGTRYESGRGEEGRPCGEGVRVGDGMGE